MKIIHQISLILNGIGNDQEENDDDWETVSGESAENYDIDTSSQHKNKRSLYFEDKTRFFNEFLAKSNPKDLLEEYNNLKRFMYDNSYVVKKCKNMMEEGEDWKLDVCIDINSMIVIIDEVIKRAYL